MGKSEDSKDTDRRNRQNGVPPRSRLDASSIDILGVAGRTQRKTEELAKALNSAPYSIIEELPEVDVVIIAVSDDAIEEVSAKLDTGDAVVAHTSGTSSINLLHSHEHTGVIWPIQSLSSQNPTDLSQVPIVVEGSTDHAQELLLQLARSVSSKVHTMAEEQRSIVHMAAVVASNFPVYLMAKAEGILEKAQIDPSILRPLWSATMKKVETIGPKEAQTGPARRGDVNTIEKHLQLMSDDADLRELYAHISRMIMEQHRNEDDQRKDV